MTTIETLAGRRVLGPAIIFGGAWTTAQWTTAILGGHLRVKIEL